MEWLGYWWLIFPLAGAAAPAIRSTRRWLDKRSEVRHQHRLEVLAAKRDLKQVEIQARIPAPPVVEGASEDMAVALRALTDEHDAITGRWLDYELDVAKLIAFPAMSDGRRPLTAAFLRAKRTADGLRPTTTKGLTKDQLAAYREAVVDFGVKFDVAEQDARRLRDADFTEEERKRLERAQQLLKTAVDESATGAERQLAYKRVREEIDGLIVLSDDAVTILETRVGKELPRGQ